jgi:hypothetical protein
MAFERDCFSSFEKWMLEVSPTLKEGLLHNPYCLSHQHEMNSQWV